MLTHLAVYRHDYDEDLLVVHSDEGKYILPPGIKAQACGMCGHDAYVTVCPPAFFFQHVRPIPICGQGCLTRFRALLQLDELPELSDDPRWSDAIEPPRRTTGQL